MLLCSIVNYCKYYKYIVNCVKFYVFYWWHVHGRGGAKNIKECLKVDITWTVVSGSKRTCATAYISFFFSFLSSEFIFCCIFIFGGISLLDHTAPVNKAYLSKS